MTYYRVKKDMVDMQSGWGLIENELLTERDVKEKAPWIYRNRPNALERVNTSCRNTHICFGVRKASDESKVKAEVKGAA